VNGGGEAADADIRGESSTVAEAAHLLAEWLGELGYLQHADAVQIVSDAFGDAFVAPTAGGQWCIRRDLLDAFRALTAADAAQHVEGWETCQESC
jgi:hypothetical protein